MQRLVTQSLQRCASSASTTVLMRHMGNNIATVPRTMPLHFAASVARTRTAASALCAPRASLHSSPLRRANAPTPSSTPAAANSAAASASGASASASSGSTTAGTSSSTTTQSERTGSGGGGSGGKRTGGGSSGSGGGARYKAKNATLMQYLFGLSVLVLGGAWAAVPLYRAFCAHTGYGGTTMQDKDGSKLAALKPGKRQVTISFNADVNPAMHWKFVPSQPRLTVRMGEPVLAFYKATNLRDKAVTGVATYNVTPQKIGAYFHKIQCFCFDEQRLRAKETVDMPVFFYIDPAMEEDIRCGDVTDLTLSYTFFPVEDDEEDQRSEEQKDREGGLRVHTTPGFEGYNLPQGFILPPGITPQSTGLDKTQDKDTAQQEKK